MKRRFTISTLVMCFVSVQMACQPRGIEFEVKSWPLKHHKGHLIETEHYQIFTTVADPVLHRAAAELAERQYQRISEALQITPKSKMKVYIFADRHQWEAFTRAELGARAGQYLKIREGGYTADDVSALYYIGRYPALAVMAHELFHLYLDCSTDERIPAWINEGLACFFEAHEWQDTKPLFTPDKNVFRRQGLVRAILGKKLYPLKELLVTHAGEVSKLPSAKVGAYYSQAWALIQFLRSSEPDNLEKLLDELGTRQLVTRANAYLAATAGSEPISFGEAVFRQYITEDLEEFERQFNAYMNTLVGW